MKLSLGIVWNSIFDYRNNNPGQSDAESSVYYHGQFFTNCSVERKKEQLMKTQLMYIILTNYFEVFIKYYISQFSTTETIFRYNLTQNLE